MLPAWVALGKLDCSQGAPIRAGSLLSCPECRGRGFVRVLGADGEYDTDTCSLCDAVGTLCLPMPSRLLARYEQEYSSLPGMGEL